MRYIGLEVNGMDFDSYDADRDPRGDIGHTLADAEFRRRGGSFSNGNGLHRNGLERQNDIEYDAGTLSRIAIKTLTRFPALNPGETRSARDYRQKLGKIKSEGYDVPPYSKLKKSELAKLYNEIREDVCSRVKATCPEVFSVIDQINIEFDEEDFKFR